jgi:hypothetical protein
MAKHQDLCFQRGSRSEKSDGPHQISLQSSFIEQKIQPIRCLEPIVFGLRQGQAWAAWTIKPTLNRNDEGPAFIPGLFLSPRTNYRFFFFAFFFA